MGMKDNGQSENWHVLPVGDIKEHSETGIACDCNPKLEKQPNGDFIVVHKSYDRREVNEPDSSIIKN